MQLSDAVANAQSQEELLQQWQSLGANAESLQAQDLRNDLLVHNKSVQTSKLRCPPLRAC